MKSPGINNDEKINKETYHSEGKYSIDEGKNVVSKNNNTSKVRKSNTKPQYIEL